MRFYVHEDKEIIDQIYRKEYNSNRRESRRHQSLDKSMEHGFNASDLRVNIVETVIRREEKTMIHNALKLLTDKQYAVLIFYAVYEYSFREIGEKFGISKDTAKEALPLSHKKDEKTFEKHPLKMTSPIKDTCINKIFSFLKTDPIETWGHINENAIYVFFGYNTYYSKKNIIKDNYKEATKKFADNINSALLAKMIELNTLHSWHTISELMETIYIFDKKVYSQVIENINKNNLVSTLSELWHKTNYFLYAFHFNKKFLKELIKLSLENIGYISSAILLHSTEGAIFLYNSGKKFDLNYQQNSYYTVYGIVNLINKNKDIGITALVEFKKTYIDYIITGVCDKSDIRLKKILHKTLKGIEHDLRLTNLTSSEVNCFVNFANYDLSDINKHLKKEQAIASL